MRSCVKPTVAMAESRPDPVGSASMMTIEIVWLSADWPAGPPLSPTVAQQIDAYALAGQDARQPQLVAARLDVSAGSTLADLLAMPELAAVARAAEDGTTGLALHGRRARPSQPLASGDRLELLGPITADPKSARLARVRHDRATGGRDKWRTT